MAEQKYVGMMFSPESIQQIVAGNKTQTRRPVKARRLPNDDGWEPHIDNDGLNFFRRNPAFDQFTVKRIKVPCKPGDIIYIKETWSYYRGFAQDLKPNAPIIYAADRDHCGQFPCVLDGREVWVNQHEPWKSQMYMPKVAARLFLEVLDVRVERLHSISPADAIAEGIESVGCTSNGRLWRHYGKPSLGLYNPIESYASMWDHVNRKKNRPKWADNPLVFAISFRYLENHKPPFQ